MKETAKVAKVVIGSNYGDEGKGLMTDYFASQSVHIDGLNPKDCMIVRFNGGAQAGHTVEDGKGRRHIFSHFGAGSLIGCPTYLSPFFIVNPIFFLRERTNLQGIGANPSVTLDLRARLSTPYDILVNQILESRRGAGRHGSCGIGINETVTRCGRSSRFRTSCADIPNKTLLHKLVEIGKFWLPERLQELGIADGLDAVENFRSKEEEIISRFVEDAATMCLACSITANYPKSEKFIFEGAQGLMLDEDRLDQWPHVTHSKTGLFNVLYLAPRLGIEALDVTYVTRSYLTRHGAGPLPGETDWSMTDRTNVPNQFQGTLRFAPLNIDQLNDSIAMDLKQAKSSALNIDAGLAMTCCDQVSPVEFSSAVPLRYLSFGPSRNDVVQSSRDCFFPLTGIHLAQALLT